MITVERINPSAIPNVMEFLKSIPSIDNVDDQILSNACIAYEENKIVGCIAFEEFSEKGLIRYFVFKKVLSMEYLESLLSALEQNAIQKGLRTLVCIAECNQIEELFQTLGFKPIQSSFIFINEENVLDTNFKKALFLSKALI